MAIASGKSLIVLGIEDSSLDATLPVIAPPVLEVLGRTSFSGSGRYVAGIGYAGTARVWDLATGFSVGPAVHYGHYCVGVTFRQDRDQLVVGGTALSVWDLESGHTRLITGNNRRVTPGSSPTIRTLTAHPSKPLLYTSTSDGRILEWNGDDAQVPHHQMPGLPRNLSVSPDGRRYAARFPGGPYSAALIDLESGDMLAKRDDSIERLNDLGYEVGGRNLVGVRSEGIIVLDGETLETLAEIAVAGASAMEFVPSAARLLVGTASGRLVALDTTDWSIEGELQTDFERIEALAFLPDGERVAVGGVGARRIAVLNWTIQRWTFLEDHPEGDVQGIACSPDGQWIAAAGERGISVWSAATGSLVLPQSFKNSQAVFTPDSKRLITSSSGSLVVLDTERWSIVFQCRESAVSLTSMCLAPNGRTVLTADRAGQVVIWNAIPMPDTNDD